MINNNVKDSLRAFFTSVSALSDNKIIRSSKYLADIAEFICSEFYGLKLCDSQRQVGYDALGDNKRRIQIKINNSSKMTNQSIGDKTKYDYLYLLVTSNSLLFNKKFKSAFILLYKIPASSIPNEKYIAKALLHKISPDLILDSNFESLD